MSRPPGAEWAIEAGGLHVARGGRSLLPEAVGVLEDRDREHHDRTDGYQGSANQRRGRALLPTLLDIMLGAGEASE